MKKQNAAKGKTENKALEPVQQKNYMMIAPDQIIVDESKNPREEYGDIDELKYSIHQNGMRNPVKAYMKDGKLHLREGFRRMRAVKLALKAGLKIERIPVIVDERALSEEERTLEFLINNDGKPFTMLEQAEVVKQLMKHGLKVTEVVLRTGKARGYIENLIMLGNVPTKIREYIKANKISAHAVIQILQAIKGDEAKMIVAVEEAIQAAKEAGKSKATPKHVKTDKVKKQSFGKFYKFALEIADTLAGRKDLISVREEVLTKLLVSFENGQTAKQMINWFLDPNKAAKAIVDGAPAKKEVPAKAEPVKTAPLKKNAVKVPAKKTIKKPAKKAGKKK